MSKFYEPMLYAASKAHPTVMGVLVVLKEEVDGNILREVVEELRVRFPYFYVKEALSEGELEIQPNPLPMTVRNSWDAIILGTEASNFHLGAWKYQGKRLAFEVDHILTDGSGVLPYIKSTLYLYLTRKYGIALDPTGYRLPGSEIPESETGNPFAHLDIEHAEPPLYQKPAIENFMRLKDADHPPRFTYIKLSEEQVMRHCKTFDGSPNAFLAVMIARAIRQFEPDDKDPITVAISVNHKAILGNTNNYRLFSNVVTVDFPSDKPLDDLTKACTVTRGQIILQSQPENSLWALKKQNESRQKLDSLSLQMRLGIMEKALSGDRSTATISYVNSRSFGVLDPYIEEQYILFGPDVSPIGIEVACINHAFFLSIADRLKDDGFLNAFLRELSKASVDYEIKGQEPCALCGFDRPFLAQ